MDGAVRVDVLSFPAATTARFLVLVAAMVAAGLFAGSAVFNTAAVGGSAWSADVGACAATAAGASDDPAAQQAAFLDCAASAERERIAFALGAAAVLLLGALVVMVLAPVLTQRRHRLTLPRADMARTVDRVQVLAAEMGLRTPPLVMLGSIKLRDAFCFGRPGAYRIALPLKLAAKPGKPLFDAAVRHEVAHLRHHDVGWSWLANSVWYVLAPLLLLPVALSLMSADYSVLPDYLWRALLLAGAVHLARRALLRSREHDADLRAARVGGVPAMIDLLRSLPRDARTGLLALHPDQAARLDVVTRPELAVRVTAVDGFTVAFFVSLAVPLLGDLAVSGSLSTTVLPFARLAVAALVAPLLGATLGLALWRQAAVGRLAGAQVRVVPVVFGVFGGSVAGGVASFSGTATDWWGQVGSLLVPAVVVTGATALVAGLGELWEQVGGGLRRARGNWVPAVVVSTILFGVALWIGGRLRLAVGTGGWDLASALVSAWMTSPVFAGLALVLAVAVAVAHRLAWRTRTTPDWLAPPRSRTPDDPRPTRVVLVGVVAGVVGALVLVGFRAWLTAPIQQEQLLDTYLWLAGAVAATAALLVGLLFGAAGPGTALLAGPIAALVIGLGLIATNTAHGGALTVEFATSCLSSVLAAGFLVSLSTGWLVLPSTRRTGPSLPSVVAVTTLLVAASAIGVVAGRDMLVRTAAPVVDDPAWVVEQAVDDYRTRSAPELLLKRETLDNAVSRMDADRTLDLTTRAAKLRSEIIDPFRDLRRDAGAYQPPNDAVREVHQHCLAGLDLRIEGLDGYASAWEKRDESLLAQAKETLVASNVEWEAWSKDVLAL